MILQNKNALGGGYVLTVFSNKIVAAALVLLLILGWRGGAAALAAPSEIGITLDGGAVTTDTPAFIDANGRTMVPLRFISEALGGQVNWNEAEKKVSVFHGGIAIDLIIGQKTAYVGGAEIEMDTTAVLQGGRTMVPLRFLAEAFGLEVGWDAEQRAVTLKSPPPPAPEVAEPAEETADPAVEPSSNRIGVVTGNSVNIRTGPGTEYERISQVNAGVRLTVLDENGEWLQVALSGDKTGWISSQYVDLQAAPSTNPTPQDYISLSGNYAMPSDAVRSLVVMKDASNIRSGPGTEYPVISIVNTGERLSVSGERSGWYEVSAPGGRTGWIAGWLAAVKYESAVGAVSGDNRVLGLVSRWDPGRQTTARDLPTLIDVEVQQTGEGLILNASFDKAISLPSSFRLSDPVRLVFDFAAYLGDEDVAPSLEAGNGSVSAFRISQFEIQTVRIVADLRGEVSYGVTQSADGLTVTIQIRSVNPARRTIVIDPGHGAFNEWGNSDPGAIGPGGLWERNVVRSIAFQLGGILINEGYSVIFTSEGSTSLSLEERPKAASISGADLFVSIHANSGVAGDRVTSGTATYYCASTPASRLTACKTLAGLIQTELLNRLQREDKGVRTANYVVLRECTIPAVLVEVAYISNPQEEKLLADPAFQRKAAEAIALGIKRYLAQY